MQSSLRWLNIPFASSEIRAQVSMSTILLNSPCLWKPTLQSDKVTLVTSPPTPLHSVARGDFLFSLSTRVDSPCNGERVRVGSSLSPLVIYFPKLNSILFLYFFSLGDQIIDEICISGSFFLILVNASFTISSLSFS